MKKYISISLVFIYALLTIQAIPAKTILECGTGTFGINVSNNSAR